MEIEIKTFCQNRGLNYEREYRFHPKRRWRFDYAIPAMMTAVEYEGQSIKGKSRHTTIIGYSKDCEKYNQAQILGWKVLRYTAINKSQLYEDLLNAYLYDEKNQTRKEMDRKGSRA